MYLYFCVNHFSKNWRCGKIDTFCRFFFIENNKRNNEFFYWELEEFSYHFTNCLSIWTWKIKNIKRYNKGEWSDLSGRERNWEKINIIIKLEIKKD